MLQTRNLRRWIGSAGLLVFCISLISGCRPAPPSSDPPSPKPSNASIVPPAPTGPAFSPAAIVQGLQWPFTVTSERMDSGSPTRTLFVSNEPIEHSGAQAVFLRATLTTRTFDQRALAVDALTEQANGADPDTGLTYAWDLLVLEGNRLHHLHAPCLFSQESFDIMAANLLDMIGPNSGQALRCRCGGGCRQTNAADR